MWRTLIKVGGQVLSAAWTATSIVLSIQQVAPPGINWLWLALAGGVVFVGLSCWTQISQFLAIRKLEDARPETCTSLVTDPVEIINANHGAVIDVTNKGAEGRFQAQVEVLRHTENYLSADETRYFAWWEGEEGQELSIKKGHTRRIKLASFEQGGSPSMPTGWLNVYRMTPTGVVHRQTSGYCIFNKSAFVIPEVVLRITISSSPVAKNGVVVRVLRIRADMKITEVPSDAV